MTPCNLLRPTAGSPARSGHLTPLPAVSDSKIPFVGIVRSKVMGMIRLSWLRTYVRTYLRTYLWWCQSFRRVRTYVRTYVLSSDTVPEIHADVFTYVRTYIRFRVVWCECSSLMCACVHNIAACPPFVSLLLTSQTTDNERVKTNAGD